ncbi:MAG: right-handed parallel beta-helix repeat-containing protein [Nitrospirae bacterium]|nr:right-handed parallel beta-helix repeat-containing protein [Nitrospirota bacterium]
MRSVKTRLFPIVLLTFFSAFLPSISRAETITGDTVWKGEITVNDDVFVPEGVTLTVLSGTTVDVLPSDRTKSEAEYISHTTEIMIRGRLEVQGTDEAPVVFRIKGDNNKEAWAGIIINGGSAVIRSCGIHNAETGIYIVGGSLEIRDSLLKHNRHGLTAWGGQTTVTMVNTKVTENEYGVSSFSGAKINNRGGMMADNRKRDLNIFDEGSRLVLRPAPAGPEIKEMLIKHHASCGRPPAEIIREYKAQYTEAVKSYGDEVLSGDTVWRGRITVDGLIRVPEDSRLIITPGTVVEFKRRDTDGDGLGENGILLQGILIAKGTMENPVIFRSAEKQKRSGDWDSINIMNSDGAQNLVEFCQVEDAYRGLHFHFSNVMVNETVLRNNYIGMQFQESAVEVRDSHIYGNTNGIRGRDSKVVITGNYIFSNINGVNFFRAELTARRNIISGSADYGFKIREGVTVADGNTIGCGRSGLVVSDAFHGRFSNNVVVNNYESGISLKGVDNIEVSGNFVQGNGLNGFSLQDAGAVLKDNIISENGERGLGIRSFSGIITGNNIERNGLYAIENEGVSDISAPANWWGVKEPGAALYDGEDDPQKGRVLYAPAKERPLTFIWPAQEVFADITWHGDIALRERVDFFGAVLEIAPASRISFSKGAGLKVSGGRIHAVGTADRRIEFISGAGTEDGLWDEILLEHADGSEFSFCDFRHATWALHSHFTGLGISDCRFTGNEGGIRFRSGPVEVRRSSFRENRVGIRAHFGTAVIEENVIVNNEVGIFVREKGSGLTISRNNICSNSNYNVRVGDFNTEDIDARENWWCGTNPADTIFDGHDEPGIGRVLYEPYLKAPVDMKDE